MDDSSSRSRLRGRVCAVSARGLRVVCNLIYTWCALGLHLCPPIGFHLTSFLVHMHRLCISHGDQLVDTGEDQAKTPLIGFHLVHTWSARSLRLGLPWQLSYHAAGCVGMAQDLTTAVSQLQHRNQLSGWQCRGVCQCRLSVWHGWGGGARRYCVNADLM